MTNPAAVDEPTPEAKPEEQLRERILVREARKVVVDLDLDISGSHLKKIVRAYVSGGQRDLDLRTWFIAYADPTGEAAVRNVMKLSGGDVS